jgi:actin-related protein
MFKGFAERFDEEFSLHRNDINIISTPNRKDLSFIGAFKFSSSDFMNKLWISKQEYEQAGSSIIHQKCF